MTSMPGKASFIVRCSCFIALVALSGVAACTSLSKYDEEKSKLDKAEQSKLDDYRAEIEIGRNMAGRLLQFYGTQSDESVSGYVNQVGAYVASYSKFPERKYMFEIIDSDIVNAFACPGGYVLVTLGAVRHARNEAELAAVLAHEVAHIGHKHMFDKIKNMSKEEVEKAALLAQARMKLPPSVTSRKRPKAEDSAMGDIMAKYLSSGAAGLSVVKAAGAGMNVMLDQGLGAEKEYEADGFGIRSTVSAGYEPSAYEQFLCRIKKKTKAGGTCKMKVAKSKSIKTIMDRTHPPVPERIANINKVIAEMEAGDVKGALGKKRFRKMKNRLPSIKS